MFEVKKKYVPYIIGIPNMGVGLLWAMNMVLIPMLAATVTQSNSKLAILVSMGAFTGIFVQYIAGLLSDRSHFKMGRRKPFILGGAFFAAIFICLMPMASNYTLLFIFSFMFYLSLNFYQGPYYSLIPEVVDDSQLGVANGFSKVISVLGSGFIFVVGPMLWKTSHSSPFFLAAALGLVTVVITALLVKENPDAVSKPGNLSFDFVKFPSVMKLYFSVFFIFLSYGCITPFFVKYCIKVLHLSAGTASTGLLLLTLVGALFTYPIGVLSDKIERRKVLLMGALIFAIALCTAIFVKSSMALYIVLSIIGIGFIAIQITIYSILAEIVPPERLGEFMGIMNLFISLSQFISNNIMGIILDKLGFSYFFIIPTVMMFISVIIIFFSRFEKYHTSIQAVKEGTLNN
jgi:MFS family permease